MENKKIITTSICFDIEALDFNDFLPLIEVKKSEPIAPINVLLGSEPIAPINVLLGYEDDETDTATYIRRELNISGYWNKESILKDILEQVPCKNLTKLEQEEIEDIVFESALNFGAPEYLVKIDDEHYLLAQLNTMRKFESVEGCKLVFLQPNKNILVKIVKG